MNEYEITRPGQRHQERSIAAARWMHPVESAERFPFESGAFWLGRSPIDDEHAIGFEDDRHVLLVAGTRSGKGRSVIVNNLALWPGSVISIDPKGENAALVARRRGSGSQYCDGLGQDVYVLDPFKTVSEGRVDHEMRAHYNPLADMDANDRELPRYAARLAESMLFTLNKNDQSWDKKGGSMIEALIMHVKTSPDFEEGQRNLVTVRRLLMAGDVAAYEALKEAGLNEANATELLWQAVIDNPACDGILSDMGRSFLDSYATSKRYYDSVKTSAEEHTKWIDSAGMREVLTGGPDCWRTFSLSELKDNPKGISVFLCLPQADMAAYARWQRMMVDLMIAEMQRTQVRPRNGHRVLFNLDEFAGLGKMERIRTAAAEIAGAGVKLFISVQGLNQLKEIYEEGWETFISGAGVQMYFGMGDNFTREYIQRALGETEIIRTLETSSEAFSRQVMTGTSEGETTGTSKTVTKGRFTGWNKSRTKGSSRNWGRNWGSNSGTGFGPHVFFEGFVHTSNYGSSKGGNVGGGSNRGTSRGTSGGENFSEATGETQTAQFVRQQSETQGNTRTRGTSQSLHKKPLITFDEANKLFARVDNAEHIAYPGFALVRIAGEDPLLVRRINHDEDPAFVKCFDPHPDHPFIPYEGPPEIEPPKASRDSVPFSMENRHFQHRSDTSDPHGLVGHSELLFSDHYTEYRYDAERIIPVSGELIWFMLCRSEIWPNWFSGDYYSGSHLASSLGETFSPGDEVHSTDSTEKRIAAVISGRDGQSLRLWRLVHVNVPCLVDVEIHPAQRGTSKVRLILRYFHEDKSTALGRFVGKVMKHDTSEPEGHREQFLRAAREALKNFANLCEEFDRLGTIHLFNSNGRVKWFEWNYRGGRLHFYPTRDGFNEIAPGDVIDGAEHIGFIHDEASGEDQNAAKETFFVSMRREPGMKYRIRDVVKKDGDMIEKDDRLFLWEPAED